MKPRPTHKRQKVKRVQGQDFYALICDDSKFTDKADVVNEMLCGVYASRKEAQEVAKEVADCVCGHYIKKCDVTITFSLPASRRRI